MCTDLRYEVDSQFSTSIPVFKMRLTPANFWCVCGGRSSEGHLDLTRTGCGREVTPQGVLITPLLQEMDRQLTR